MSEKQVSKLIDYIYNNNTTVDFGALFSDGTEFFRFPQEPKKGESVKIRFRTARDNVDAVYLVANGERKEMEVDYSDSLFDYYASYITDIKERVEYHFEIQAGKLKCYFNKLQLQKDLNTDYDFEIIPDFVVPAWAKGAVFYQIFVERFCKGDDGNTVLDNEYCYIGKGSKQVRDWSKYPEAMDVGNFYGGDLQGVINKLDYLKGLGVDVIYLNPIFVSPSNHKYDIQDYDYVDPHYGKIVKDTGDVLPEGCLENRFSSRYVTRVTDIENLEASNQLFIELVEKVHERGMKIILDGVFNHCGSFNKWLDRERIYEGREGYAPGAYVSKDSPYHTFFKFNEENSWPYNGQYDGWWGHDTLPKLNYEESDKLYDYIMRIGRKWVSPPFNVDGWRLDVAADLGHSEEYNHRFWRDFRRNVKEANPNAIILAEHYGNPKPWLLGDQWDTIMNYDAFMEPITWFLTGVEKHSDEFRGDLLGNPEIFKNSMLHHMSHLSQGSIEVSMNELSNHDHSRFLTRTNRRVGRTHTLGSEAANENVNKGVFREAVVFQMTWPGAPTLYYGDEAGMCGWTDPDNRRTYPWGHEDKKLIDFHRDMIKIHKESKALMNGSVMFLENDARLICYGRFTQEEAVVVVLNNNYEDKELSVHVRRLGVINNRVMKRVMLTTEDGYDTVEKTYMVQNNMLKLVVPAVSASVYVYKRK